MWKKLLGKIINKNLKIYKRILYFTARNLTLIYVLFFAMNITNIFPISFYLNIDLFFHMALLIDVIAIISYFKFEKNVEKVNNLVKYSFIILLIVTITIEIDSISKYFSFLSEFKIQLFIITTIFGTITFWQNRKSIEKIEFYINEEGEKEREREKEFSKKFYKINGIPVIGTIVKWIYKEGLIYSLILGLIMIWGGFLIFHNLGSLDFYHDEQWHVCVIESLIHGEGFKLWDFVNDKAGMPYNRSYITNWFSYCFSMVLGYNEFTVRLFVAIIGLLDIFMLYVLFKDFIGKIPALLTSLGFIFNIIVLYLARFLRGYTIFLLFLMLSFYMTYKLVSQLFNKKTPKKIFLYGFFLFLFLILTIQSNQTGKIFFLIIPIYFLFYLLIIDKLQILNLSGWKKILILLLLLLILLLIINYFKLINLDILPEQIAQFISIDKIKKPTKIYFSYLFEKYIKSPTLMYFSFGLGCLYLITEGILKKKEKSLLFFIFTTASLFIMIYFFNQNEDFRYIYYLIPFVYGTAMYGLFKTINGICIIIKKIDLQWSMLISILFVLLLFYYPILPIQDIPGFSLKSPSIWEGYDGKIYLHRRAVAPEYSKIYNTLNNIQKERDIVIIGDGIYYLKSLDNVDYYTIPIWNYSKMLHNEKQNTSIDFFELMKNTKDNKVYYVGAYVHMLDPDLINYLLGNCYNMAEDLHIMKYNYNGFYKNKFYWPNLFVCNNS